MDNLVVALVAVYGLIIGSFLDAFVWRFRQTHDDDGNVLRLSRKRKKALSIMRGRSMCPACGHKLRAVDLVPVASWLWLRGKCRYCKTSISRQHPLVEAATALLFVVSYSAWPYEFSNSLMVVLFVVWLVLVAGFVTLAVYDTKWYLLPDKIVFPLFVPAVVLLGGLAYIGNNPRATIITAVAAGGILYGFFAALYYASKGMWIGGGDVKLALLMGLLSGGLIEAVLLLFLASVIGLVASIPLLARKGMSMKLKIPFGPMLLLACFIVFLWGERIVSWYMDRLYIV